MKGMRDEEFNLNEMPEIFSTLKYGLHESFTAFLDSRVLAKFNTTDMDAKAPPGEVSQSSLDAGAELQSVALNAIIEHCSEVHRNVASLMTDMHPAKKELENLEYLQESLHNQVDYYINRMREARQ